MGTTNLSFQQIGKYWECSFQPNAAEIGLQLVFGELDDTITIRLEMSCDGSRFQLFDRSYRKENDLFIKNVVGIIQGQWIKIRCDVNPQQGFFIS